IGLGQPPRRLSILIRLLDDLELRPSLIEAKSVEPGVFAAHCQIVARVRANDRTPRPNSFTVHLASDREDAKLKVSNTILESTAEAIHTYRLDAELKMAASALPEKYNHFELLGMRDRETL